MTKTAAERTIEPADFGPAVTSWGVGRLDVFWRRPFPTSGSDVSQLTFANNAWGSPVPLAAPLIVGEPAATSWGPGRIDLFWRGSDNHLRHNASWNGTWEGADELGGSSPTLTPSVSSRGLGLLDVYWPMSGGLGVRSYNEYGAGWTNNWGPNNVTSVRSAPASVSWDGNRYDVFWRGPDDHLKHKWYPYNGGWSGEEDLGGTLNSAPTVASWGSGRLDVFWRGTSNTLKHIWYPYNGQWSWEQDLGGNVTSRPAAVSWGAGRIDVFWTNPSFELRHRWYPYNNDWSFDEGLGPLQAPVSCAVHDTCGSSAYCELANAGCTDTVGTCAIAPMTCSTEIAPSCGCDGVPYGNDCERQAGGVPKWFDGNCYDQRCPYYPPQSGASCTVENLSCVYSLAAPNRERFKCTNGVWSVPDIVSGF